MPGRVAACLSQLALVLVLGSAGRLEAGEPLCVTCAGPDRTYQCTVEGAAATPMAMQLLCIQQLAREGGHRSCAVRKASGECLGEARELAYATPDLGAPVPKEFPVEEGSALPEAAATPAPPPASSAEPDTLIELAGQTIDGTGKQLKKAGETIGDLTSDAGEAIGGAASKTGSTIKNAAKSTWSCLTSLFSDCSGEPEADATEP